MTAQPTEGDCHVALLFHIDKGAYGEVKLDGLNLAVCASSDGPMGRGNWTGATYVDERAGDRQMEALGAIFSGAAGGPMAAFAPLFGKSLGVKKTADHLQDRRQGSLGRNPRRALDVGRALADHGGRRRDLGRDRTPGQPEEARAGDRTPRQHVRRLRAQVGQFGTERALRRDQLVELIRIAPREFRAPKLDANMTNGPRDAIRAQARTGLTLWVPALAGWVLLYWGATNMASPVARLTMPMSDWSATNFIAVFIMWAVMMAAMMLPSATPMASVFATLNERRGESARTAAFVAGYVALWVAFGAAATAAQWALQRMGLLSPMIVSVSPALSGALLIIAGVFQFTPLKQACLRACRSPLGFLLTDWRDGLSGAAQMGVRHGLYCLGCCWALMALLVCRRGDEFALDRGAHPSRRHGEARPEGRSAGQGAGSSDDRCRRGAIDLAAIEPRAAGSWKLE